MRSELNKEIVLPTTDNVSRRDLLGATAGVFVLNRFAAQTASAQASGQTIYIGGQTGILHAFTPNGNIAWAFEISDESKENTAKRINSAPTVVNGTVYFGTGSQAPTTVTNFYAIDAASGEEEWRFTQASAPIESSPTFIDGIVYFGSQDDSLYALDADSGEKQWTYEAGSWIQSASAVVDGVVFVGSWDNSIYAIDAETGEQRWEYETGDAIDGSPTVYDGSVYIGSGDGYVYAFDTDNGEKLWRFDTDVAIESSPTIFEDAVHISSGDTLYALDTETGAEQWSVTAEESFESPTVSDGTVYVGDSHGKVYAIKAESGEIEWEGPTNLDLGRSALTTGAATVINSDLYIPHGRGLMKLDTTTREAEWIKGLGGVFSVGSAPTVVTDPQNGDSVDSRVERGTFGHHHGWADRATHDENTHSVSDYTNDEGVVETHGILTAIGDWRAGELETGVLLKVIEAWRHGESVT